MGGASGAAWTVVAPKIVAAIKATTDSRRIPPSLRVIAARMFRTFLSSEVK
jgi:hypothetical protein